jgi:hypothetical protein
VDRRRLGVEPICEVLQVAPSTYYAAKDRVPSARAERDQELVPRLVEIWKANYEVYGSRKLWKAARRAEIDIGRDQTRRLRPRPASRALGGPSGSERRAGTAAPAAIRIWSSASSGLIVPTSSG